MGTERRPAGRTKVLPRGAAAYIQGDSRFWTHGSARRGTAYAGGRAGHPVATWFARGNESIGELPPREDHRPRGRRADAAGGTR